jgi:hypothetical protein
MNFGIETDETLNKDRGYFKESMAPRSVRFGVRSRKLSNVGQLLDA